MPSFFKKEEPSTKFYLPIGMPVAFETVDGDYGYLATDDGYVIKELMRCVAQGVAGITEITEAEYRSFLEKKRVTPPSALPSRQRPTIGPASRLGGAQGADAVPAATSIIGVAADGKLINSFASPQKSDGLKVERTFVKPRVGRIGNDQS